ncbi:MAG: PEP-CTERM sorting domain-containing protein [Planctomycetota bacterium]
MKACQTLAVAISLTAVVTHYAHADIEETGQVTVFQNRIAYGPTGFGTLLIDDGVLYNSASQAATGQNDVAVTLAEDGGIAFATVTGSQTRMQVTANLIVGGNGGNAFLQVLDGAGVDVTGRTIVDTTAPVSGGLIVSGTDSLFAGGNLDFELRNGPVVVENNALLITLTQNDDATYLGGVPGTTAELTVRTGGTFDASATPSNTDGDVFIGEDTNGQKGKAIVNIESGGRFLADDVFIRSSDANPASITVRGTNSLFDASRQLQQTGSGSSTIRVSDGGTLTTRNYQLGFDGNHQATVESGGTLVATGNLQVGRNGGIGRLVLTGADTTAVGNSNVSVGWIGSGSNGIIDIGRGATLTANGSGLRLGQGDNLAQVIFRIGDDGTGLIDSGTIFATELRFGVGTALFDLQVDSEATLDLGDKFVLIDYDTLRFDVPGQGFQDLPDNSVITRNGLLFLIDYDDDLGGGDLALTATVIIPEPAALALLALGGGLLLRRRPDRDPENSPAKSRL